jgi:multidrug efflux system outer membrane protein
VTEVLRLEILIPQQENLISLLIGHSPRDIERGLQVNEWPIPLAVPAGLPSELLEQRPDILKAERGLIAANARIGEARAQYFPSISLTGYLGSESIHLHHLFTSPTRAWQYAANLLQSVFTGGRITNNVNLAKARKAVAYYNYQQTVLNAFKEVDDALIAHQKSKELIVVQKDSVAVLKDYLYLAKLQYDNGQTDYLNVLDAERRLFTAQLSLAQAEANVFITLIQVYQALGGGWVIEVENLNPACTENNPLT